MPEGHSFGAPPVRCRESGGLSSVEQVAVLVVERQQTPLRGGVRLDAAVVQNVTGSETVFSKTPCHQEAAVTIKRLAFGAQEAEPRLPHSVGQPVRPVDTRQV